MQKATYSADLRECLLDRQGKLWRFLCPSCNCISTHPDVYSEDIRIGHAETVDKILKWLEREFLWVYECLASLSLKPLPSCLSWKDPTTISGKSVCDAGCQPNSLPSIFLSYFSFVDSNGQNDFDTKSHVRSHNNSFCLCKFTQFTLLLYSRLLLTLLRNQSWVNLKVWHWKSVNPLGKQRSRCLGPKRKPVCKCEKHMKTQSSSASVQGPWKRYQLCYGWRGANSIGNHELLRCAWLLSCHCRIGLQHRWSSSQFVITFLATRGWIFGWSQVLYCEPINFHQVSIYTMMQVGSKTWRFWGRLFAWRTVPPQKYWYQIDRVD